MRFRLDKAIGDVLVACVKRAGSQVSSAAPRVAHRSRRGRGALGGRLVAALRQANSLVRRERWGGVILWNNLGQPFMFFARGTRRQKPRPVELAPKEADLRAAAERAAADHIQKRDRRRGRR